MTEAVAKWHRYGSLFSQEFDSVDDAFRFLASGEDKGDLSSVSVECEGKVYTHGSDEFYAKLNEAWDTL